jgi:hypothetical protein
MSGTSYIINGYTNQNFSRDSIVKIAKKLKITSGIATTYSLNSTCNVTYEWIENEYDGEVERIEFKNTEELLSICNSYFVRFIQSGIRIGDKNINGFLGTTIHKNNKVSIYIQFNYSIILFVDNLKQKQKINNAIRDLCVEFYSTGLFEIGNAGEEITEFSLEDICNGNAVWELGDYYFKTLLLSSERQRQLLNLPVYSISNIGTIGYFIALEELIHEMNDVNAINEFNIFLKSLEEDLQQKYKNSI